VNRLCLLEESGSTCSRRLRACPRGTWSPLVPSVVLVESDWGSQRDDAAVDRLLEPSGVSEELPVPLVRHAGDLRDHSPPWLRGRRYRRRQRRAGRRDVEGLGAPGPYANDFRIQQI
jgi:hypothetical protein